MVVPFTKFIYNFCFILLKLVYCINDCLFFPLDSNDKLTIITNKLKNSKKLIKKLTRPPNFSHCIQVLEKVYIYYYKPLNFQRLAETKHKV